MSILGAMHVKLKTDIAEQKCYTCKNYKNKCVNIVKDINGEDTTTERLVIRFRYGIKDGLGCPLYCISENVIKSLGNLERYL